MVDEKKTPSASQLFIPASAVVACVATVMLAWFNIEALVDRRIEGYSRPIEQRITRHEEKKHHDGIPQYVDARLSDSAAQMRQAMIELKALIQDLTKELQAVRESVARLEARN
jgi:hypothetical protein